MSAEIPRFFTLKEVAAILRCSPTHVSNMVASGALHGVALGKRRVVIPDWSVAELGARPDGEEVAVS